MFPIAHPSKGVKEYIKVSAADIGACGIGVKVSTAEPYYLGGVVFCRKLAGDAKIEGAAYISVLLCSGGNSVDISLCTDS